MTMILPEGVVSFLVFSSSLFKLLSFKQELLNCNLLVFPMAAASYGTRENVQQCLKQTYGDDANNKVLFHVNF